MTVAVPRMDCGRTRGPGSSGAVFVEIGRAPGGVRYLLHLRSRGADSELRDAFRPARPDLRLVRGAQARARAGGVGGSCRKNLAPNPSDPGGVVGGLYFSVGGQFLTALS